MVIKVLSENTKASESFASEHGLCLYVETEKHKLLFDTGAGRLFAENAEILGVDIANIDLAVISHGHYDHGGGLKTFLNINGKAKIYLRQKAFEKYYSNRPGSTKAYIGLDETLLPNERFVFCGERFVIDENLELFSGVNPKKFIPSGNGDLFKRSGEDYIQDDFMHEQSLIIDQNGKTLLIAGCAHCGIANILEKFEADRGRFPDYVIGGFHLYNLATGQNEDSEAVKGLGSFLLTTLSRYYTCHCTGIENFKLLKAVMAEKIDYISTGSQILINM